MTENKILSGLNLNIDFDELAYEINSEMEQAFEFMDKSIPRNLSFNSLRKTTKTINTEANV